MCKATLWSIYVIDCCENNLNGPGLMIVSKKSQMFPKKVEKSWNFTKSVFIDSIKVALSPLQMALFTWGPKLRFDYFQIFSTFFDFFRLYFRLFFGIGSWNFKKFRLFVNYFQKISKQSSCEVCLISHYLAMHYSQA